MISHAKHKEIIDISLALKVIINRLWGNAVILVMSSNSCQTIHFREILNLFGKGERMDICVETQLDQLRLAV